MTEHTTTVVSVTLRWPADGIREWGYRAVCSCGWKSRKFPLEEIWRPTEQADAHVRYQREVARLTADD